MRLRRMTGDEPGERGRIVEIDETDSDVPSLGQNRLTKRTEPHERLSKYSSKQTDQLIVIVFWKLSKSTQKQRYRPRGQTKLC